MKLHHSHVLASAVVLGLAIATPDFSPILPDGVFKGRIPINVLISLSKRPVPKGFKVGFKVGVSAFFCPIPYLGRNSKVFRKWGFGFSG